MKKHLLLLNKFIIVADESFDYRIIQQLRKGDVEVIAICEDYPSITDEKVLQIAVINRALLITEDKDFGELVFRLCLSHCGVLLIRIEDNTFKIETAVHTIKLHFKELIDRFSVLTNDRLRIKAL